MAKILEVKGWYYVLDGKGKLVGALLNYQEAKELADKVWEN